MPATDTLLTVEEYAALPDDGRPTELVRGRVVDVTRPRPRHGEVCSTLVYLLRAYLKQHPIGRVVCNDTGIITERAPDSLRGADVAYFSYKRVPKGPMPRDRYLDISPEIVFEVLSPGDRRAEVLAKVAEYLNADVLRVGVADPQIDQIVVYAPDEPERILRGDEVLTFPDILPGFSAPVSEVFA